MAIGYEVFLHWKSSWSRIFLFYSECESVWQLLYCIFFSCSWFIFELTGPEDDRRGIGTIFEGERKGDSADWRFKADMYVRWVASRQVKSVMSPFCVIGMVS